MRRLLFGLIAVCLLVSVVGCRSMQSDCGGVCRSGGCSGGACASGACGRGVGGLAGGVSLTHSHGICDCQGDDHCSSRAPWIRLGFQAPAESLPLPMPAAKDQPDAKGKQL